MGITLLFFLISVVFKRLVVILLEIGNFSAVGTSVKFDNKKVR